MVYKNHEKTFARRLFRQITIIYTSIQILAANLLLSILRYLHAHLNVMDRFCLVACDPNYNQRPGGLTGMKASGKR